MIIENFVLKCIAGVISLIVIGGLVLLFVAFKTINKSAKFYGEVI